MENNIKNRTAARGAFWTSAVFYGLIAFEFFYMFSPFAVYLYGVYGPGLNLLAHSETTSWLIAFFMPHIARETQSFLVTWHEAIGMILFIGGLAAFFAGVIQIYRSKFKKSGAVVGGIYRHIRHPQYLALMISGLGMVLVWPRYLVLFGFITVCFAYYFLARIEEKSCKYQFPGYDAYMEKTGMFFPRWFEQYFQKIPRSSGKLASVVAGLGLYGLVLGLSFFAAGAIHSYSVGSLYTYSTQTEAYLSAGWFGEEEFEELMAIANSNRDVAKQLSTHQKPGNRFINYVMPTDLLVSEVPMHIPEGRVPSHRPPGEEDQTRYKIIYTLAEFGRAEPADGLDILRKAIHKTAVLEVWIDRNTGQIERILQPPDQDIYNGMPVPVF